MTEMVVAMVDEQLETKGDTLTEVQTQAQTQPPTQQQHQAKKTDMPPADAKEHLSAIDSAAAGAPQSKQPTKQTPAENEEQDEEVVVTLDEVLRQDAMLTETADAVLGASSESDCSYPLGYIRQALYACLTCTPESADETTRAGVCLACSYNCHENHELIELYTKRDFRCDCGNTKFPKENPCKLVSDKAPKNERNLYSQNFMGKYCSCHRPYPDPERTTEEIMLQCVVCEDWLHAEHVFPTASDTDADVNDESQQMPDDFDDFICIACMEKHQFLLAYDMDDEDEQEVEQVESSVEAQEDKTAAITTTAPNAACVCLLDKKLQMLDTREDTAELKKVRPTFWAREWRDALCKCAKCVSRFEKAQIAFLLDPEDSLQSYEEAAHERRRAEGGDAEEQAVRAFSSKLSHQQQVEMAIGYSHMKNSLQEYLSTFAAGGKTVRAEDIQSFFENLRQKKRQKTDP